MDKTSDSTRPTNSTHTTGSGCFIPRVCVTHACLLSLERLRYPGFVVPSCFTDVFAIDNDIMRKMCTLITSKGTDIDENIANQNHATRTPKPGYLNL